MALQLAGIVFMLFMSLILIVAFFKDAMKRRRVFRNGIEIKGVVWDFTKGEESYPIIRFTTIDNIGISEQYEKSVLNVEKGDDVDVIYNKMHPTDFIIIGSSTMYGRFMNYLSVVLGSFLFVMACIQIKDFLSSFKR